MYHWGFFMFTKCIAMKKLFLLLCLISGNIGLIAQHSISGKIVDYHTLLPILGAQIFTEDQTYGTTSDQNGFFRLEMRAQNANVIVTHIGYLPQYLNFDSKNDVVINLKKSSIDLEEVQILANSAIERYNPIAFTNITSETIARHLGDKPLPEILNRSSGVYASRDGGGSGDASIALRGFQQENIAVLLNGVPINGAENGLVYWNNWMGLSEVASSVQMQKGIGSSRIALNSVGGTINIVTVFPKNEPTFSFTHLLTSYGNRRTTLALNSGDIENGWNLSFLGSRTSGEGYIDATYVYGWAYFLNLSKQINSRNRLLINLLGGPERHGQRNLKLSNNEIERYGHRHNKDWGALNGSINNASENFYHKPHFSVSHYLDLGMDEMLATSVYISPGWGGGKWNDSFNYGPTIFEFRNPSGQIDWDAITYTNANHEDNFMLSNGEVVAGFSKAIQTYFLASHFWGGILSSHEKEFKGGWKLSNGVHYRYFQSDLRQEVADLLGGSFYIDDFSWSLAGTAGRNQIKMPGDVIRVHNGATLHQTTAFSQIEKAIGRTLVYTGVNVSDNRYRRHDIYNYPHDPKSEWVNKQGVDIKAGINHRMNDASSFFINAAYLNKAPYYKFVFGNNTNEPVLHLNNEKVKTAEAGYQFRNLSRKFSLSAYYTSWKDVSFLSNEYIQLENNTQTRAMVNGLNATHKGIEAEWSQQITPWFALSAIASAGNWKWQNDVEARLMNESNVVVDTVNVFAKGLYVGGQPQLQAGIMADLSLLQHFKAQIQFFYYDRHFATFDPAGRQNPEDRQQSFRIPSSSFTNLFMQYPIRIGAFDAELMLNINNIFNKIQILKGEDGSDHSLDKFRGFWSFGRTIDVGIRLQITGQTK